MNIIYKITYIPHLGTEYPKYYVGSKTKYKGNYFGSVDSRRVLNYTNGLPLREWWRNEIKRDISNFIFEIISIHPDTTAAELVLIERKVQESLDVIGPEYFNQCLAAKGFCSGPKDEDTKAKIAASSRAYWATPEGIEKRKRLSERNINKQQWKYVQAAFERDPAKFEQAQHKKKSYWTDDRRKARAEQSSSYWTDDARASASRDRRIKPTRSTQVNTVDGIFVSKQECCRFYHKSVEWVNRQIRDGLFIIVNKTSAE